MTPFLELLAKKISPDLLSVPLSQEKMEAINSIRAKEGMSELNQSRQNERDWKNGQRRSLLSRSSTLLKRKRNLLNPNHPINTGSLLGGIGNRE